MSDEIQRWADEAMYSAEKRSASDGPKVHLLHMNADPLASVAACAKMYKGEVVRSLSDVTHAERKEYLAEMQKTKLKMPLEAVTFHFMMENVTRAFTHQLVRQRTAAYAQESMRFAVVEDMTEAVALPPSLAGTMSAEEYIDWFKADEKERFNKDVDLSDEQILQGAFMSTKVSKEQKWRFKFDRAVGAVSDTYSMLVNDGMPAEDARGLTPTNILTRVHYITNLRALLDHAGNRLCTQAQFEWRLVFSQISRAIRNYRPHAAQLISMDSSYSDFDDAGFLDMLDACDRWQYEAIADLLKPVCYQVGKCVFEADFDRKCSIRSRVQANAEIGRSSDRWHLSYDDPSSKLGDDDYDEDRGRVLRPDESSRPVFVGAISPAEWLADPNAAR